MGLPTRPPVGVNVIVGIVEASGAVVISGRPRLPLLTLVEASVWAAINLA